MQSPPLNEDKIRRAGPVIKQENNAYHNRIPKENMNKEDIFMRTSSTSTETKRNWKGLLLALLVIFVISALILLACFLTYEKNSVQNYGKTIILDDILLFSTQLHRPNPQFVKGNIIYLSENGSLIAAELKTNKWSTFMTKSQLQETSNFAGIFSTSDDMAVLLLRYNYIPVYRRSYLSNYQAVISSNDSASVGLTRLNIGPLLDSVEQPLLYHAEFSTKAQSVAFVYQKQLYYKTNPFSTSSNNLVNVTADMACDGVLFGLAGFLYEEEIIGTSKTFWWSPDGMKLAFTEIDERNVTKTKLQIFEAENPLEGEIVDHRYTKAGETNPYNIPVVKIYIHSLITKENIEFSRPRVIPWNSHLLLYDSWRNVLNHEPISFYYERNK